ncbi:hypothetical protein H6G81_31895 [Scytonema hofmannii FACHB-248]|uniref:Uncharacterized protein n=1 Tax=Scytonema hofmannii FACHB-248 TaxID=1842502 RepID=A0ABR8H151_9CYAN|nr:hypothetical protein [Scytonema hofmannii FACHB-248]
MKTQEKGAIATKVDRARVEQYTEENRSVDPKNFYFLALSDATETILRYAFFLADLKKTHSKKEYKQILLHYGFSGEEKKYLKVAAAFEKFSPDNLAPIEPATIFQLAQNSNKYQPVLDQLLDLAEISQTAVRDLIKKHRTPKQAKTQKPSIWRRTKNGARYCQIPPIHEVDETTGTTLQKMIDEEGLLPQQIVAEAIALRLAYQQGRLKFV